MQKKYLTDDITWVEFYPKFNSSFFIEKAGYFDERPCINTSITQLIVLTLLPFLIFKSFYFIILLPCILFGWGRLYINLPIKTGIQDCDSAAWGINYHDDKLWIYIGGAGNFEGGRKWKTITMPWDYKWYRTSLLLKDQKSWVTETKNNALDFYKDQWNNPDVVFIETYPYIDSYDGTEVEATIRVREMEWRQRWLYWTSLANKVKKQIDITFNKEVGKNKGSWKGGVIGCSFTIEENETPEQCLKRMEQTREF